MGRCVGCSWKREVVGKVGEGMGKERVEYGCDVVVGGGMKVDGNGVCGGKFEYY